MESIAEEIGHTPMVQLKRAIPSTSARLFAKLERFNPGGSLKDRIVLRILDNAEAEGNLKTGSTIVGGTTGNSGIALAYLGNVRKYRVILMMPEDYSQERRKILEGYGAEVHLTPAAEGMAGALSRARKLAEERGAFFLDQFENRETVRAHETTTAREILEALAGPIHAYVGVYGTGGSMTGVGTVLKNKGARVVAVEPASAPLLSGGMAGPHRIEGTVPGFVSALVDRRLIDEVIVVSDQQAFDAARELARQEGLFVGISSGAAFFAARRVARILGSDKTVVTIFPDGGERYLSVERNFQK